MRVGLSEDLSRRSYSKMQEKQQMVISTAMDFIELMQPDMIRASDQNSQGQIWHLTTSISEWISIRPKRS